MIARRALVASLIACAACVGGDGRPAVTLSPSGPPTVQPEVVERHAEQFEQDVARRPPGSQEEFAAATYITAHLQQAGYVVRLDSVPVANTVRSSNVVAFAPGSDEPRIVVAVSYGTGEVPDAEAGDIGAFLEVARVLRVRSDDHAVEFVALGAQSRDLLGSRRLAQFLLDELDEDVEPRVVYLSDEEATAQRESRPLTSAGFEVTPVTGSATEITDGLLAALDA